MDYLQYLTQQGLTVYGGQVLNLIINGLPSIFYSVITTSVKYTVF